MQELKRSLLDSVRMRYPAKMHLDGDFQIRKVTFKFDPVAYMECGLDRTECIRVYP